MKTFFAVACAAVLATATLDASHAADAKARTVASIYKDKASLAGKEVRVQGKVVKVNNGIMGRNFLHLQDGTGKEADNNNDLTVTSTQTAKVGDAVTITGKVIVNKDFGAGYAYPVLIEEAAIVAGK